MMPVVHENKFALMPGTAGIDRTSSGESGADRTPASPAGELASVLRSLSLKGVDVSRQSPLRLAGGITVDVVVSGPRGMFGVICDAIDSTRIRRRPGDLAGTGLTRVYCVSALESLMNPVGIAQQITGHEPGSFRCSFSSASRRRTRVERIGCDDQASDHPRGRGDDVSSGWRAA